MKNNKSIFAIAAGLVLAGGIIGWLYWGGDAPVNADVAGVKVQTNAALKNSVLKREQDGKTLWEFTVAEVENIKKDNKAVLKGIKGKIYRSDGSWIDVEADKGEAQITGNDFALEGKVKAVMNTGGEFSCDKITYNQKNGQIVATGKVKLVKDGYVATADRAESTSEFIQVKLKGNAKVEKGGK